MKRLTNKLQCRLHGGDNPNRDLPVLCAANILCACTIKICVLTATEDMDAQQACFLALIYSFPALLDIRCVLSPSHFCPPPF